jgi:hypothetical protein
VTTSKSTPLLIEQGPDQCGVGQFQIALDVVDARAPRVPVPASFRSSLSRGYPHLAQGVASTAVFYVAPSGGYAGPNAYQGILLAQQEVASFAPVVDRPAVMGPMITHLRLATTPAQLAKQVFAISPTNGVLVDATAE